LCVGFYERLAEGGNTHVVLLFSISMQLTNVLKHYATSYGNNPDKWTELAKCLISGLPPVNSQVRCLTVLGMASQAFNALKELSKAHEDLEKTRAQLEQRKKEHKDLQSRLREPIGNTSELPAEVIKAQQQVAELQDELKRQEAQCKELEDQLNSVSERAEETRLQERCKALEVENEVLRKQFEERYSTIRQWAPFHVQPPPVRVIAEGDNEGGPTSSKQVSGPGASWDQIDQAKSAFSPARLFPEEPTRNSQICNYPQCGMPTHWPFCTRRVAVQMKTGCVSVLHFVSGLYPSPLPSHLEVPQGHHALTRSVGCGMPSATPLQQGAGRCRPLEPLVSMSSAHCDMSMPLLQVDQASSAFKPTQLSFEEPIGDAQGRSPLVEHEVAMQRQRSPVDNQECHVHTRTFKRSCCSTMLLLLRLHWSNQSDEEMSLRARCKELEEENGALRKELEELKSRSRPQVFTVGVIRPPPVRVIAEGDNVAGPSGIQQTRLVEQEVAMHRHRSPVSNQTPPQPAAQPPGGAAGPSRADQRAVLGWHDKRCCCCCCSTVLLLLLYWSNKGGEETRLRARCKELEGEKEELRKQLEESRSFQQPSTSDEETRLRARCKELEEENGALRRQPAESRSLQQVSTVGFGAGCQGSRSWPNQAVPPVHSQPPPAWAVAEGDNVAGPSGIKQVSGPDPSEDEVQRRVINVSSSSNSSITIACTAHYLLVLLVTNVCYVQASPSSSTPDRSSDRTNPASQFPPPSIDEFGRLSKAELKAKITKLTQRGCVFALRYAGILTKCPNRDPGDDLVKAQLFEIAGWLLPDTSLPGSIADLVKLLKNKGKMTDGGQDVIGSRELVQAAYDKYPAKLAPAIQLVPWEYTHLHIQGLKNLLIRLGVDEVREANDRNKSFPQPYLRQKANELTGAALAAPAS
ncbi:hypothetical protein QJQ45_024910, partial [Haematococcus lacustris]